MFTRMGSFRRIGLALAALIGLAGSLGAEEIVWRASRRSEPATPSGGEPAVRLGLPLLTGAGAQPPDAPSAPRGRYSLTGLVRAQGPELGPITPSPPPPPPPPGGLGSPFPGALSPAEEAYNCGIANQTGKTGGFFQRFCDNTRRCWDDITGSVGGAFQPGAGRGVFQSDHAFDGFISPVTNPFYFEDPRSLTEFRPIFMWQRTPGDNPIFAGGDNFFLNFRGSLAITERISITLNRLGFVWQEIENPSAGFANHFGFSELHLGPKFTVIRNDTSNTLLALGLVFEIPIGSSDVEQDTGNFTLRPYLSFGQSFWRSDYGTFNFLNTTGYAVSLDSSRTDFLFSSFHLDYNIGNLKVFYPFLEMNFLHYTMNGSARSIGFEGNNLFNFGSDGVAGNNELTLALGMRYLVSQCLQFGIAGETSLLGGGEHMDRFRFTFDVIFRY